MESIFSLDKWIVEELYGSKRKTQTLIFINKQTAMYE